MTNGQRALTINLFERCAALDLSIEMGLDVADDDGGEDEGSLQTFTARLFRSSCIR
jgi:hypothetical protein